MSKGNKMETLCLDPFQGASSPDGNINSRMPTTSDRTNSQPGDVPCKKQNKPKQKKGRKRKKETKQHYAPPGNAQKDTVTTE